MKICVRKVFRSAVFCYATPIYGFTAGLDGMDVDDLVISLYYTKETN